MIKAIHIGKRWANATDEIFIVADSCSLRDFVGDAAEFLGVGMPEIYNVGWREGLHRTVSSYMREEMIAPYN